MAEISSLGKYEIRREIGRGAMGVVYEGYDPLIKRIVALKTIRADQLAGEDSANVIARFRREAQAAGRLNHPNIVSIYDFGEDAGVWYIAMEFVKGRELKECFEAERALHDRRHRADHVADPRGARLFAPAGRHPSRHQAREHLPAGRRLGEGRATSASPTSKRRI